MGDRPLLVIFAGLPGAGKTTLAKALAEHIGAVYLRVDSIEQVIVRHPRLAFDDMEDAGYQISHAVASDNLRLGHIVIADQVNDWELTRRDWLKVAQQAECKAVEIEIICSDTTEHKKRIEERQADIADHIIPTWQDVLDRDYHPFDRDQLVIDTAGKSVPQCLDLISRKLAKHREQEKHD